jgi:hypothetical protein
VKNIFLIALLSFCFPLLSQEIIFQKVGPLPPALPYLADFLEYEKGTLSHGDVDNDGDIDVFFERIQYKQRS